MSTFPKESDEGSLFNPNGYWGFRSFEINFKIHNKMLSKSFYDCINQKASKEFFRITNSLVLKSDRCYSPELETIIPVENGIYGFKTTLHSNAGSLNFVIKWKSFSGLPLNFDDDVLDCNDMKLWFEDFDLEQFQLIRKPIWSLMPKHFDKSEMENFQNSNKIPIPRSFLRCADFQLTEYFTEQTGIPPCKQVCFSFTGITELFMVKEERPGIDVLVDTLKSIEHPSYHKGDISSVNVVLWIRNTNYNDIQACWKSVSGKIYEPSEEVIDCNDIVFWFSNFEPLTYQQDFFKNQSLPFSTKTFPFEIKVNGLGVNMNLIIHLLNNKNGNEIVDKLYNSIEGHNLKSELKNRKFGVVHNCEATVEGNTILFRIDTGSAGVVVIKKLLKVLAKFNEVKEVIVDV